MSLTSYFYLKNPNYKRSKKYDSRRIGDTIIEIENAYFMVPILGLEDIEYIDVTKGQIEELLKTMYKWKEAFTILDFTEVKYLNWGNEKVNDPCIEKWLDDYIPQFQELLDEFDWDNDTLTVLSFF